MRKILALLVIIILGLGLFSCGESEPPPKNEEPPTLHEIDLIGEGYVFVNNTARLEERGILRDLIDEIKDETDYEFESLSDKEELPEKAVLFGSLRDNELTNELKSTLKSKKGKDVQAFALHFEGDTLVITSTDEEGLALGAELLLSYVKDGKLILPEDLSLLYAFSSEILSSDGSPVLFSMKDGEAEAPLSSLFVNGEMLEGFSYDKFSYTLYYSSTEDYPSVTEAFAVFSDASVSITQPSKDNGGVGKVTVSREGGKYVDYTLIFEYGENVIINSEIVNKDNTGGVVSFVFDDGIQKTADIIETNLLPKYDSVRLSYAIVTDKLATLRLTSDGTEWEKDESGRYLYDPVLNKYDSKLDGSQYSKADFEYMHDFWSAVASRDGVELLSHSHTHSDWGMNDKISYDGESGNVIFPRGNVIKELLAPKQILWELCGEKSYCYIKPGVGACSAEKYYLNLIESSGIYIGARSTALKVNLPAEFSESSRRFNVYALAAQHYNTEKDDMGEYTTEYGCGIDACLEAGIPVWTDYIDDAISKGGWACFCLHGVVPDTEISNAKHYIFESQLDMLFSFSEGRSDEGKLWIATYSEAQKYYNEWASATVETIVNMEESVTVSISDGLDDEIYDMPLTVKVMLPRSWNSAKCNYQGEETELTVYGIEDGAPYVFVNVIPDCGKATITAQ